MSKNVCEMHCEKVFFSRIQMFFFSNRSKAAGQLTAMEVRISNGVGVLCWHLSVHCLLLKVSPYHAREAIPESRNSWSLSVLRGNHNLH